MDTALGKYSLGRGDLCMSWMSFFHDPNFQYKGDDHGMLITILLSFLNKNINIIMDCSYNGNTSFPCHLVFILNYCFVSFSGNFFVIKFVLAFLLFWLFTFPSILWFIYCLNVFFLIFSSVFVKLLRLVWYSKDS